jgi:hypothetical protein
MLVDHMLCVIDGARPAELAQLGSDISRAYANGAIGEDDHQRLWEAIQERRQAARPKMPAAPKVAPAAAARRAAPRSPDRQASILRRRRLVASGPLPPQLAARFTWGEQAVMRIVGDECRAHGCCTLHIDAIAARAGVHRTTVQNALREATGREGGEAIVTVHERRRPGQRSLTNIIRIVSKEWSDWLRRRGGFKQSNTTDTSIRNTSPRMVSGYRSKRLGERWRRQEAGQKEAAG